MNFAIAVAFLCLGGSALAYEDGSYRGEGLAESQDYGQYNQQYYSQPYAYNQYNPVNYQQNLIEDDGSWKGEGLAESQDNGQYNSYGIHNGGGAPLGADGRVVDTPEVAQAKAAHFAALAAASHGSPAAPVYAGSYGSYGAAHIELTPDGKYVKDTPEVAQAKAAHFAAFNAVSQSHYGPAHVQQAPIYGQYGAAPVELTADGKFLKDTPEVAHAKAQHLAALAAASSRHY